MRKDLFKTLFSRMLTTYLGVILCLLLLMGIMVSSMFRSQHIRDEEQSLRKEGARINTILAEQYVDENKRAAAEQELLTTARQYDALVHVVDSTKGGILSLYDDVESEEKWGVLVEAEKRYLDETPARISLPGIDVFPFEISVQRTGGKQGLFSRRGNAMHVVTEEGEFYYDLFTGISDMATITYVRAYVSTTGEYQGVILIHRDMRAVNSYIQNVFMDVMLISLLAILVAVLAVYYLTTYITKPIVEMNSTVRKYSKGEFALRLNAEGTDEVAQLAKSFNAMAEELNALEQTRRSLVANVSHELRSPISSIRGFLEAIQDGTVPPEKRDEYMSLVIAETKRMTNMINSLLDLARMESGENEPHLTRFDINELFTRILLTFEAPINAKRLDVEVSLMKPYCIVEADADQITQVLRNLIDNAIKFSPEGGKLVLKTALKDRRTAQISVQDFGCGIAQEDMPRVFQRFFKAEKAHTPTPQSGTGLGLSIARVIIDQHGQDIWVESGEGKGTTFAFTLKYVIEIKNIQELRRKTELKSGPKGKRTGG
ncbi:cell wall metabolism sensor histidine kinase WalK [Christensenellaceae bacterium OttesenSCG-928-L17]|nr:cell wall metabolism sensor histidine kinase WalK [Christensenellaceae bacterium OttesenSCG-928-L17]